MNQQSIWAGRRRVKSTVYLGREDEGGPAVYLGREGEGEPTVYLGREEEGETNGLFG